jgi:Amt family ammonium transporter
VWNKLWPIRVSALEEAQGLNVAEHRASTEIYDLYRTLEDQAKTGDLSLRAPVEPFTEVGQIATQYNRVMDNLQTNLVARSEYVSILDNVHEGLLLLDAQGQIGPFYSSALERILEGEDFAGRTFDEVMGPLTSPSALTSWPDFLGVLFDSGVDEAVVQRLNPVRELALTTDLGSGGLPREKHVQVHFRRIMEREQVIRAMVIVRDMTEEIRLKKTLDLQHRDRELEMELFYKLLHVDPALLSDFLASFQDKTAQINRLMETGQNAPKEVIKQSLRLLHSIKGEAALLELDFVAEAAHRLEDMVVELQKKSVVANADFLGFALKFAEFQTVGERMTAMVGRLKGFQTSMVQAERAPDALVVQLETLVRRTADARGKNAALHTEALDPTLLDLRHATWKDILVQLVRNAVVHGIEPPVRRESLRKPPVGTVVLASRKVLGGVEVSVKDDGSGLDLAALRLKAKEEGWQDFQLDKWAKADWIKFLFTDGVSTAAVGMEAGRGVGLALVGRLVKEAKGKLGVRFEAERFLEFQVTLPDPKG